MTSSNTIQLAKFRMHHAGFPNKGFVAGSELEAKKKYVTRILGYKEGTKSFETALKNTAIKEVRPAGNDKKASSKKASAKPAATPAKAKSKAAEKPASKKAESKKETAKAPAAKASKSTKPASTERKDGHVPNPAKQRHFSGAVIIDRDGKSAPSIKGPDGILTQFDEAPSFKDFMFAMGLYPTDMTDDQKVTLKVDHIQFNKRNFGK